MKTTEVARAIQRLIRMRFPTVTVLPHERAGGTTGVFLALGIPDAEIADFARFMMDRFNRECEELGVNATVLPYCETDTRAYFPEYSSLPKRF